MVVKLFYQIFFANVFGFDKLNVKFYIFWLINEKMPIIQTENYVNVLSAEPKEKLHFVLDLLDNQREPITSTLQNVNLNQRFRVLLRFVMVICNDTFCRYLLNSIKNEIYTLQEFVLIYIEVLDKYVIENVEVDFLKNRFIF